MPNHRAINARDLADRVPMVVVDNGRPVPTRRVCKPIVARRACEVGIIGGGPGGLMTAYALQDLADGPMRVTLFEASARVGGKIMTPHFATKPVRYEAGAAEFYDYSHLGTDPLKELIAELGLSISPMGGSAVISKNRVLANLDDIRDALGPHAAQALIAFDRRAKDAMTPREFFNAGDLDEPRAGSSPNGFEALLANVASPEAQHYIGHLIHSDLAAEPCQTSVEYGLQNYLMNDPGYLRLYCIDGGNERLPQALAARLSASTLLEHRVESVERLPDARLRVKSQHRGQPVQHDFDVVVVALPHNHVMSVTYGGDRLARAVREHHHHYDHPAHYLRVTALFEHRFWRETIADSYWMLDACGGCCLYDESSRDPSSPFGVLSWLFGGTAARDMSALTDEQLIARALEALPHFLAPGRTSFLEGRVDRWVGAVNAMPGGAVPRSLDRRHQPEPVEHANLFMVGDYMYDSTLNGVLDSAEHVAAWIAATVADASARNP